MKKNNFNDKNVSMIIRRIKGEWNTFFTQIEQYRNNPNGFKGRPKPPKAKKLSKVIHASIPLEVSKFSLKKHNKIGLTLGRKQFLMRLNHKGMIEAVGIANINNIKVVLSNNEIYLQFSYTKHFEGKTFLNNW